jgi:secondary thiamine-phosphate synthase enzyme
MEIVQREIALPPFGRGCHHITDAIVAKLPELGQFRCGMVNIFLQHTSASLTVNEGASGDVLRDLESWMNRVVPEGRHWEHSSEGRDDMPAHAKCSMMGVSLNIPVAVGKLALAEGQGICLNEHRARRSARRVVLTVVGQK